MPPAELGLAQRWREEALLLRRRAATLQAEVLESCAAELEACSKERDIEALTLSQAADESGFTYSALEKMVRRGAIANVGRRGAPRVRRRDLPRRANPGGRELAPDLTARVLGR